MENNFLETLAEKFGQTASIKNVYGEPITTQGKTVIPVAKIAMGLGGGYGKKNGKVKKPTPEIEVSKEGKDEGSSAGGGGGMFATAKGVYEITSKCTRFIPANAAKQVVTTAAVALLAG